MELWEPQNLLSELVKAHESEEEQLAPAPWPEEPGVGIFLLSAEQRKEPASLKSQCSQFLFFRFYVCKLAHR